MYGKLIDGVLHRAPRKLPVDDTTVYNPSDEQLLDAGYKPVLFENEPYPAPEGKHWESELVETGDAIVQEWYLVDNSDELSAEEALDIILGGGSV